MDVGAIRQLIKRFKPWRTLLEDDVNTLTESGGTPVGRMLTLEEQDRLRKTAEANREWEHVVSRIANRPGRLRRRAGNRAGAIKVMDLRPVLLKQVGVASLNLAFLGRWIGHLPRRRWSHPSIARATPVRGESWIGWCAHYSIGITFSALLLWTYGVGLGRSPSVLPALIIGMVTVVAPLIVLQPAMGGGITSSKTPTPVFHCMKSLVTHTVFGLGMHLTAPATASPVPFGT